MIETLDGAAQTIAAVDRANPALDGAAFARRQSASHVLCWSGTLAGDWDMADPRHWMSPGQHAFDAWCDDAGNVLRESGRRLILQPHARHLLSDLPGCVSFLRRRSGEPFDLALSPATMLERSMLRDVEDHLSRSFEMLGPRCAMVIMEDVLPAGDAESLNHAGGAGGERLAEVDAPPLSRVPLGRGVLPRDHVLRLLNTCLPPATPVVLMDTDMSRQVEWLDL